MTNASDQITAKTHTFTKKIVEDMVKSIRETGADFKMSEIILYDIAILRLESDFDEVDWKSEAKVNYFIEGLLNDAFEIQKLVKIKIRNLPHKKGMTSK